MHNCRVVIGFNVHVYMQAVNIMYELIGKFYMRSGYCTRKHVWYVCMQSECTYPEGFCLQNN